MILTGSCKDKPQNYTMPKGREDSFYERVRQLKGIKLLQRTNTHLLVTPSCTSVNGRIKLDKLITQIQTELINEQRQALMDIQPQAVSPDESLSYELPRSLESVQEFYRRVCQLDFIGNVQLTATHLVVTPKLDSFPEEARDRAKADLNDDIVAIRKAQRAHARSF